MRILIDIGHPAHVHFFRHAIKRLEADGHELLVTSRDKEIAVQLLDGFGIRHKRLSSQGGGSLQALGRELVVRNIALLGEIRRFRPDAMAAIGGIFIAQTGFLTRTPSLVFYDTENATLQNALTYPFASAVLVPRCYGAWLPKGRGVRYPGYHELAYLHPNRFKPDRGVAVANGLAPTGDTFFVRIVSWQANHDLTERGWSKELLNQLIRKLSRIGKVLISAEGELDDELIPFRYGGDINQVHHLLAFCRAFVGESATMASEAAVLGTPALYIANTGRGYTDEQESRYGLVRNLFDLKWQEIDSAIDQLLAKPRQSYRDARQQLLTETIDVTDFIVRSITTFPAVLKEMDSNPQRSN